MWTSSLCNERTIVISLQLPFCNVEMVCKNIDISLARKIGVLLSKRNVFVLQFIYLTFVHICMVLVTTNNCLVLHFTSATF